MATSWIHANDLLDGTFPDVCATSGLPSDTMLRQEVAVLAADGPRRGRRFRLDLRLLWDHAIGGRWLEDRDRWTHFPLPYSWEARERIEGRAAWFVGAFLPATIALAHGMVYAHAVSATVGLVATVLVVAGWSMVRAQRLRVVAFDGNRYLVSGLHRRFVRALDERPLHGPPAPIGAERLRPTG